MNTYFGAAVLALDINHDGLADLLVGAPLYSQTQDEGRVYIFTNEGRVSSPCCRSLQHFQYQTTN